MSFVSILWHDVASYLLPVLRAWGEKKKITCVLNREFALLFHFALYFQSGT